MNRAKYAKYLKNNCGTELSRNSDNKNVYNLFIDNKRIRDRIKSSKQRTKHREKGATKILPHRVTRRYKGSERKVQSQILRKFHQIHFFDEPPFLTSPVKENAAADIHEKIVRNRS